jgi:Mce-associated membrane protein
MEGDAGISQLNPTDAEGSSEQTEEVVTEAAAEETASEAAAEETASKAAVDETASAEAAETADSTESAAEMPAASERRPSRLNRDWLIGICAALLVLGAGVGVGGYFALRAHSDSQAIAHQEAVALQAAKDCVAATQAPDTAAMAASQQKIIDCSTGDFAVQANMYAGMLVDAYQAANVQVKVSDMRAAIERHNDDGSVQVLVAVRVQVTNSAAADQEQGYRLRVRMAPDGGAYKIAKLDQVTS